MGQTPRFLMIKHTLPSGSTGVAQLPFEDLADDWKQRYGYNRDAALAYEASRRQALADQAQQQVQRNVEILEMSQIVALANARADQARQQAEAQAQAQAAQARARAEAQAAQAKQEWQMQ